MTWHIYYMSKQYRLGETVQMRRLTWAFSVCLCDKFLFDMSWLFKTSLWSCSFKFWHCEIFLNCFSHCYSYDFDIGQVTWLKSFSCTVTTLQKISARFQASCLARVCIKFDNYAKILEQGLQVSSELSKGGHWSGKSQFFVKGGEKSGNFGKWSGKFWILRKSGKSQGIS